MAANVKVTVSGDRPGRKMGLWRNDCAARRVLTCFSMRTTRSTGGQWGDEAFAEARRRDVPVLLSVGYSACHWCHVMAHESFEDAATAELMNSSLVSIKVDREERPDVDAVYMTATQAMTGQGGWPMTVFMTPDREPFYCGTYYPREHFGRLVVAIVARRGASTGAT